MKRGGVWTRVLTRVLNHELHVLHNAQGDERVWGQNHVWILLSMGNSLSSVRVGVFCLLLGELVGVGYFVLISNLTTLDTWHSKSSIKDSLNRLAREQPIRVCIFLVLVIIKTIS
jgi:hypothetical protein